VQLCGRLSAVFSQQWFIGFHYDKGFRVSDSSLHHNMACIIYLSHSIYIHTANLAADSTGAYYQGHLETLDWENFEMHLEAMIV
jgi:hypothetical protein